MNKRSTLIGPKGLSDLHPEMVVMSCRDLLGCLTLNVGQGPSSQQMVLLLGPRYA